jgi:hypothetical protein
MHRGTIQTLCHFVVRFILTEFQFLGVVLGQGVGNYLEHLGDDDLLDTDRGEEPDLVAGESTRNMFSHLRLRYHEFFTIDNHLGSSVALTSSSRPLLLLSLGRMWLPVSVHSSTELHLPSTFEFRSSHRVFLRERQRGT